MWLLLLSWIALAVGQEVSPPSKKCQNETILLDEYNSTWKMPHGVLFEKQSCTYEFFYPEDTFLRMTFGLTASFCTATIVDAFNVTMEYECWLVDNFSFPPPQLTVSFHFTGFSPNIRESWNHVYFLKKFTPFNSTDYLPIAAGSEPLTIRPSTLKNHRTYVFDGMPSFTAYYLTREESFVYNTKIKAESLFLLDGNEDNVTVSGTVLHWTGPQEAQKMILYNALYNGVKDSNPMLLFIHIDDLAEYNTPRFKLESYKKQHVVLDSSEGMTSLTIPDFGRTLCNYYSLHNFQYSKDVEMLLVNGFPKANISEGTIIQKYNSSNLSKNLHLIVGCTKSLIVLNGSASVTLVDRGDVVLNHGVKGIIRTESEKDEVERLFVDYEHQSDQWYSFEFKWSKDSSPNARLIAYGYWNADRVYGPPKTVRFTATRQRVKITGLTTLTYSIVKADPPATTTRSPSNYLTVTPPPSPYQNLPICVRFRFMECIYVANNTTWG